MFVFKVEPFWTRKDFNLNFTNKALTVGIPPTFCFSDGRRIVFDQQ